MKKPRNPVAEAAAYLTKPARHRDRKHDYVRSEKHRTAELKDAEVSEYRKRRLKEQHALEDQDRLHDIDWERPDDTWVEPWAEDPSDPDEVQPEE